jgi:hypothetical protein
MNKNVKKTLLFFAVLILVIVIIAAVYLLLLAPDGDTGETPSPSASVSEAVSPPATVSPSETAPEESETPTPADNGHVKTEETADGIKYRSRQKARLLRIPLLQRAFLSIREQRQRHFMDASEAGEYMSIAFIEDAKAAELAQAILIRSLIIKSLSIGMNFIPGTEIPGETVMANDGDIQFEAWLVDTDKGVLAVVISYSLRYKEDKRPSFTKCSAH